MQLEELEAEVRKARRENRDLQDQLAAKTQEAAALQSEAAVWKSIKETERNNMMQTNTQLNQQLSEQILRAKTLEGQLSHTQADLVSGRGTSTGHRQSTSSRAHDNHTTSPTTRYTCLHGNASALRHHWSQWLQAFMLLASLHSAQQKRLTVSLGSCVQLQLGGNMLQKHRANAQAPSATWQQGQPPPHLLPNTASLQGLSTLEDKHHNLPPPPSHIKPMSHRRPPRLSWTGCACKQSPLLSSCSACHASQPPAARS